MIGGHDSTASGLQFLFYNLALNPEHQQKCREEVMKVLDGKDYMDWWVGKTEKEKEKK